MDPLSIIASTITVVQSAASTYKAIQHLRGLPRAFEEVNQSLPLVQDILEAARRQLQDAIPDDSSADAIGPTIQSCQEKANALLEIFQKIDKEKTGVKGRPAFDVYRTTVLRLGKAHRVETLMQDILKGLKGLAIRHLFQTPTQIQVTELEKRIQELSKVEPSMPDSDLEAKGTMITQHVADHGTGNIANHTGPGQMKAIFGGNNFESGGAPMHFGMGFTKNG
ncbi:WD domain-containing protein [Thozetella sp. PMI_491]|nr:WD domain-containing protein [Thozetella sp. PMI_491]